MEWITSIIGEILFWFEDDKFRKRKKARRKYEKENNLPKKLMIHPAIRILGLSLAFILVVKIIIGYFYLSDYGIKETSKKIAEIQLILEDEKREIGNYPEKLNIIIRNNPLRKNLITDYWKNEFSYELSPNGLGYSLISKGMDGILNTEDDIKRKVNLP